MLTSREGRCLENKSMPVIFGTMGFMNIGTKLGRHGCRGEFFVDE